MSVPLPAFAGVLLPAVPLSSLANRTIELVAVTIAASTLPRSSTGIVVARWFDDEREVPARYGRLRGRVRAREDTGHRT